MQNSWFGAKNPDKKGKEKRERGEIEGDWSAFNMQCYKNEQRRWPKEIRESGSEEVLERVYREVGDREERGGGV